MALVAIKYDAYPQGCIEELAGRREEEKNGRCIHLY
jgi:hypothetical protein